MLGGTSRGLGRSESRHLRGEIIEPSNKAGMLATPAVAEAEVTIAARAGERDLPDIGHRIDRRRPRLENGKCTRHLAGLEFQPFWLVHFRFTIAALVHGEDRGIEDAVGERLQA